MNPSTPVSRETHCAGLHWREDISYGTLLHKRVEIGGTFHGYALCNAAQVRVAASDRAALLLDALEKLTVAQALGAPLDSLLLEARALIQDVYAEDVVGSFDLTMPLIAHDLTTNDLHQESQSEAR